ncbi:exported hypothetical protein [Candidatus Xenohaliotis californiensis]|uniref:Uncharacterized protein n=1 Tax=Candidatus Xenohaliotis californiensis TaxID=84677 RepID=A0ABP0ES30_9RICK|nr:exported hypothetical protein [Candidatus Xenohaliotis californiensis]
MKNKTLILFNTMMLGGILVIFTNAFSETASCKCSLSSKTIKDSMQKSLQNSDIVVHGVVTDIVNIDSVHYIAKISNSNTWHASHKQNVELKKSNNILEKILNNTLHNNHNNISSTAKNTMNDSYYYILSSRNPEDCGAEFKTGWNYLVYANKYNNLLITSACHRTAIAGELEVDITALNNSKAKD